LAEFNHYVYSCGFSTSAPFIRVGSGLHFAFIICFLVASVNVMNDVEALGQP